MGNFSKWVRKSMVVAAAATIGLTATAYAQATPEKFKVGAVLSLSGPYGLLGEDMRRGVQIAVEERGGKVLGVPIEITWEDDETKPQPAVQKATKLISEGSHMIFGALSSASTLAVMNVTKQRKIPHLVTISADDKITVPVLGFWGVNDAFNPVSGASKLVDGLPHCRVSLVTQCGHWVQVEHQDMFNRTCIDFLQHG